MTCAEVLESVATASLRDMSADSAVMSHCATCPDCARVTTMLREKEYEAASVLNDLPPMSNPITVAEQSVVTSKRRRVGRVAVIATGTALVATIWIAASLTIIPQLNHADARLDSELRTETMQLTCLSPQQAGDIINPYVRSHGSSYYIPSSGISAITVRGTRSELAKTQDLIAEFENDPGAAFVGAHPNVYFVPAYERNWYLALAATVYAREGTEWGQALGLAMLHHGPSALVPVTGRPAMDGDLPRGATRWGRVEVFWSKYLEGSADDHTRPTWEPRAREHLAAAQREKLRAAKQQQQKKP